MLTITWEYLLGRLVAADPASRDLPEWPPHPDRVFMALVASWGESAGGNQEAEALRWLEELPPPCLRLPPSLESNRKAAAKCFVPVNDKSLSLSTKKSNPTLRELSIGRNRRSRTFARFPVSGICALYWPDCNPAEVQRHLPALRRLCLATPSLGHSSSLVRLWAEPSAPPDDLLAWDPVASGGEQSLRVASKGRLDYLVSTYANGGADWSRPQPGRWVSYRGVKADGSPLVHPSPFDEQLLILKAVGPNARLYGAAHAPALADAMRRTLMAGAPPQSRALELISGHAAGSSARLEGVHCAFLGLPFVGSEYADGHLLGMAMALPRELSPEDRESCEAALARSLDDQFRLRLVLGAEGHLDLEVVTPSEARQALQSATWCPRDGACHWATATPIVLDRLPQRRVRDVEAFMRDEVTAACLRVGLPEPAEVGVSEVSPLLGAPHARQFPAMKRKSDGGKRWHVHAAIRWADPIRGPVLLGAGRYRGMGLLKPVPVAKEVRR
jgi:CRISPR-associated protein Csb2